MYYWNNTIFLGCVFRLRDGKYTSLDTHRYVCTDKYSLIPLNDIYCTVIDELLSKHSVDFTIQHDSLIDDMVIKGNFHVYISSDQTVSTWGNTVCHTIATTVELHPVVSTTVHEIHVYHASYNIELNNRYVELSLYNRSDRYTTRPINRRIRYEQYTSVLPVVYEILNESDWRWRL